MRICFSSSIWFLLFSVCHGINVGFLEPNLVAYTKVR